jgi:uncharacterized membrane protein YgcG
MATTIAPVDGTFNVKHAMLVDLNLTSNVYYVSTAWKPVTYNTNTYTELGAFLSISDMTEDIKTTNGDITLQLTGIPSNQDYMAEVLTTPIKGGEVTVYRAFFNDDYSLDSGNVFQRFKGIITNFAIEETENILEGSLTSTIGISCASINTILENKVSGQRTAPVDRDKFYPGDQTFYRVPELQNVQFDFGREYTGGSGYGGGGGGGRGGGRYGGGPFSGINVNLR